MFWGSLKRCDLRVFCTSAKHSQRISAQGPLSLDGGNRASVVEFFIRDQFRGVKNTIFKKAFRSLKNCLD